MGRHGHPAPSGLEHMIGSLTQGDVEARYARLTLPWAITSRPFRPMWTNFLNPAALHLPTWLSAVALRA